MTGLLTCTPSETAIDAWFENLQNYEATLEEMAAASLDANFKEELSAIEQCQLSTSFHRNEPLSLNTSSI